MKLTNYNVPVDRNRNIDRPHTFLNEAKLTAIALSIRLAILRTRVFGDVLKMLVLDDLLISLDMSNRDIVVNMLMDDDYLKDYQIIMLTHDKAFFERSKEIFNYRAKGQWKYFEMFVEPHDTKDIEVPYIKEYGQEYGNKQKAEEHYRNRDYPAAANYLRKEVEKLYRDYLDLGKLESIVELSRKKDNYEKLEQCFPPLIKALKSFENCKNIPEVKRAKKCVEFADKIQIALNKVHSIIENNDFFDIGIIKDHVLNPQSHNDFTKPLYRKELEDAFEAVKRLQEAVDNNILTRVAKKREARKDLSYNRHKRNRKV